MGGMISEKTQQVFLQFPINIQLHLNGFQNIHYSKIYKARFTL